MKITVNDKPITLDAALSLTQLLIQLSHHQPGIALARNQTIVPRQQWDTILLNDGDQIVIFQAIAGG